VLLARTPEWPADAAEAEDLQRRLAALPRPAAAPLAPATVAGLDVAYDPASDRVAAAVVVLDAVTAATVEVVTHTGRASFGYVPGLLAFRELPPLVAALADLVTVPDLLICDGYGVAHPRRFGLACHLGVLTDLPTIGVAKTPFLGGYDPPGPNRGDWSDLYDGDEVLGRVLRTRTGVKPIFVSVGHRAGLADAARVVLDLCRVARLPETTRRADHACRAALAALLRG
jgi:deoxyribonuclease V